MSLQRWTSRTTTIAVYGKMDPVSIKYTNIFHCQSLQNLPKFGFLV
jgi:hypothetical protein